MGRAGWDRSAIIIAARKQREERDWGTLIAFKVYASSDDVPPPARPCHLTSPLPPKIAQQLGTKHSTCAPGDMFHIQTTSVYRVNIEFEECPVRQQHKESCLWCRRAMRAKCLWLPPRPGSRGKQSPGQTHFHCGEGLLFSPLASVWRKLTPCFCCISYFSSATTAPFGFCTSCYSLVPPDTALLLDFKVGVWVTGTEAEASSHGDLGRTT